MTLSQFFALSLTVILAENYIFVKYLGICPFIGASQKISTACGMGTAVTFVIVMSSAATYGIDQYLLRPFGLDYLRTVAFVLVIAGLVQFVEMFLQRVLPGLHTALGIYLPLITTNCAVLAVAIIISDNSMTFGDAVLYGLLAGVGFFLAIVLFAGVRERLEYAECPKCFEGFPIALVSAALLAMSFMGFSGMRI